MGEGFSSLGTGLLSTRSFSTSFLPAVLPCLSFLKSNREGSVPHNQMVPSKQFPQVQMAFPQLPSFPLLAATYIKICLSVLSSQGMLVLNCKGPGMDDLPRSVSKLISGYQDQNGYKDRRSQVEIEMGLYEV